MTPIEPTNPFCVRKAFPPVLEASSSTEEIDELELRTSPHTFLIISIAERVLPVERYVGQPFLVLIDDEVFVATGVHLRFVALRSAHRAFLSGEWERFDRVRFRSVFRFGPGRRP